MLSAARYSRRSRAVDPTQERHFFRTPSRLSRANSICPWADSRTARWWPTELPTDGQWGCPV